MISFIYTYAVIWLTEGSCHSFCWRFIEQIHSKSPTRMLQSKCFVLVIYSSTVNEIWLIIVMVGVVLVLVQPLTLAIFATLCFWFKSMLFFCWAAGVCGTPVWHSKGWLQLRLVSHWNFAEMNVSAKYPSPLVSLVWLCPFWWIFWTSHLHQEV